VASFLLVFYGDAVCFRPSSESFGNDDRAILPRCATPSLRVAAASLHLFHDRNFSSGYLRENLPEMLIRTGTARRTRLCNRPPSAAPVQKKEVCARENAAGTKRLGPTRRWRCRNFIANPGKFNFGGRELYFSTRRCLAIVGDSPTSHVHVNKIIGWNDGV
jgi:hypothetical protein